MTNPITPTLTKDRRLECMSCHERWTEGVDGRDDKCDQCFNPHVESGKTTGCQLMEDIPHTIIEDFGSVLDRAMNAEYTRQQKKRKPRAR